ncbi:MAG: response regulator [Desulfobacterales bacterium]|nr:response regulator [Desulfobacterales bacterium]
MGGRKKILIIDDEKDFGYFLKFNLELIKKFKVFNATNGKAGIKLARRKKPDLIILDIMMPGLDGFDVLTILKENMKTTAIPVIMMTALDQNEPKEKACGLYCADYFTKPIEIDKLISGINNILSF